MTNQYKASFLLTKMAILVLCLLTSWHAYASGFDLLSVSVRTKIGDKQVLGNVQPESFRESDVMATFRIPYENSILKKLSLHTRLLVSGGIFQGAGKTALVVSAIPALALATQDGRFEIDAGAGLALLSKHRYGRQDFGGPIQFALTVGGSVPIYGHISVGYRFMHYSDAAIYGSNTTGADFQMIELIYRY